MNRILILDNYDSFTYNLVQMVREMHSGELDVFRNDKIELEQITDYTGVLLSPGPGIPEEAGILLPLIEKYASKLSILGVCLGHQAIGQSFGASLLNLSTVYHGIATPIELLDQALDVQRPNDWFRGMDRQLVAGRYHSWVIDQFTIPDCLEVTSKDNEGHIMSVRHKVYDVQGVQFHPESILTDKGAQMIKNWLSSFSN